MPQGTLQVLQAPQAGNNSLKMQKQWNLQQERHTTIQQPFGVFACKNGTKQGVHIDLLKPSLPDKGSATAPLDVQSVGGKLTV